VEGREITRHCAERRRTVVRVTACSHFFSLQVFVYSGKGPVIEHRCSWSGRKPIAAEARTALLARLKDDDKSRGHIG
jgi:hypothetical protein